MTWAGEGFQLSSKADSSVKSVSLVAVPLFASRAGICTSLQHSHALWQCAAQGQPRGKRAHLEQPPHIRIAFGKSLWQPQCEALSKTSTLTFVE